MSLQTVNYSRHVYNLFSYITDWVTDDEPCSSGSECNSRGSSAGRGTRCDVTNTGPVDHLGRPDRPGPDMSEATFSLRLRQNRVENLAQQLTLEIPYGL